MKTLSSKKTVTTGSCTTTQRPSEKRKYGAIPKYIAHYWSLRREKAGGIRTA